MLVGGAIVVGLSAVTRLRKQAEPVGVEPWTAWAHAVAMALVVGVIVLVLGVVDIPHGYWIAMTMTIVLRPYGAETQSVARQRVVGTTLGAVLALGLALVLPAWMGLAVAVALLVLVVANALMGRYAQQVTFLTPFIVLIGAAGGDDTIGVAVQRVGQHCWARCWQRGSPWRCGASTRAVSRPDRPGRARLRCPRHAPHRGPARWQ